VLHQGLFDVGGAEQLAQRQRGVLDERGQGQAQVKGLGMVGL
jgi:hypothetical protein